MNYIRIGCLNFTVADYLYLCYVHSAAFLSGLFYEHKVLSQTFGSYAGLQSLTQLPWWARMF